MHFYPQAVQPLNWREEPFPGPVRNNASAARFGRTIIATINGAPTHLSRQTTVMSDIRGRYFPQKYSSWQRHRVGLAMERFSGGNDHNGRAFLPTPGLLCSR